MAERRAVNKYYPPDWDPSKGSINTYNKIHPLRGRAKKIDQGILVVRFGMPFNVWCLKCENHIGMGVRYNAEKSRVGNYYTTPIYQFKMKCHLCDNFFVIETDPGNFDYVVKDGARRQLMMKNATGEDEPLDQKDLDAAEEAKRRITDSMFRLEKNLEDKAKSESELPNLKAIKEWRDGREDTFSLNQLVRSQYRERRRRLGKIRERDRKLLKKASLKIPLLKSSSKDIVQAKQLISDGNLEKLRNSESKYKDAVLNAKRFILPSRQQEKIVNLAASSSQRSSECQNPRIKKEY